MERESIKQCLETLGGVSLTDKTATVDEGHRLSIYVGEPGHGMSISGVESIELHEQFAAVKTKAPDSGRYCIEYRHLTVAVVRDDSKSTRRTGFV